MELIRKNLVLTAQILEASWKNNVQGILAFSRSTVYPVAQHPVKETEAWSGEVNTGYFGYGWIRDISRSCLNSSGKMLRCTSPWSDSQQYTGVMTTSILAPATSSLHLCRAVERQRPFVV